MKILNSIILITLLIFNTINIAKAADTDKSTQTFRLGYVGSLSSFAANYGTAVLEGAQLAVAELQEQGIDVKLFVEDDQSVTKNTVSAYLKLVNIDKVQVIISGSWWANAIVKQAERDGIPLLSCETLYNDDIILGKSYFIMNGDLRQWIDVYEPLIRARGWKKGAIVRYTSGFGSTLESSMKNLFTKDDRKFVGAIEYNDINMSDAADIVLKIRKLKPEVLYIDAQPSSLANLLRKLSEAGLSNIVILTNSIAEDVNRDQLFDTAIFKQIYFTRRSAYDESYVNKFKLKFQKDPYLNSDLGYYAVHLAIQALSQNNTLDILKRGINVKGHDFSFNEHNVYSGIPQEIYKLQNNRIVDWQE